MLAVVVVVVGRGPVVLLEGVVLGVVVCVGVGVVVCGRV